MILSDVSRLKEYWLECERQLFAMTGMNPDSYQRILSAIRAVSDELLDYTTQEALESAWSRAEVHYQQAAEKAGFSPKLFPYEKIAGAAYAMREKQLRSELQRSAFLSKIEKATRLNKDWVILHKSGDMQHGLMSPFQCTDMNLRSGLSIVTMTQADPTSGNPVYVLSVIKLDRATGNLMDAEPGIADWMEFETTAEVCEEQGKLRAKIESLAS